MVLLVVVAVTVNLAWKMLRPRHGILWDQPNLNLPIGRNFNIDFELVRRRHEVHQVGIPQAVAEDVDVLAFEVGRLVHKGAGPAKRKE